MLKAQLVEAHSSTFCVLDWQTTNFPIHFCSDSGAVSPHKSSVKIGVAAVTQCLHTSHHCLWKEEFLRIFSFGLHLAKVANSGKVVLLATASVIFLK